MAEHLHPHYDDNEITNVETHHESSDVNVRALIWFGVIVVIFALTRGRGQLPRQPRPRGASAR